MSKMQIGWYILPEAKDFYNEFETAAWFEKVHVEAGRYPVYVYDCKWFDGRMDAQGGYVHMDGVIVCDNFQSLYCGVPIGKTYDGSKNAGKPSSHSGFYYLYTIAEDVLKQNGGGLPCETGHFELLPEFEAKEKTYYSEWENRDVKIQGIYRKEC